MKKILFSLFAVASSFMQIDAQKWTTYTTKDGLASNNIHVVAIDTNNNNKWIGTDYGASVFDGDFWSNILPWDGFSFSYDVNEIIIDGNYKWLGTNTGIIHYLSSDHMNNITPDGLLSDRVHAIALDGNVGFWFGTGNYSEGNVVYYIGTSASIYKIPITDYLSKEYYTFLAIAIDSKGNKWFGTDNGILKFDSTSWTSYFKLKDVFTESYISFNAVAADKQGNVWFGSGGVYKFDGTNWTNYTTADGLVSNGVNSIAIDSHGNKWFGTYGGVSKFNDTTWTNYTTDDGLASNNVTSIAIDTKGIKWFGTWGGGISKFVDINSDTSENNINSVTDAEGNKYHIITIGTQTWMAENLKTTKYRNGEEIPNITDHTEWTTLTTGAYCNYYNDINFSNKNNYGKLYNWHAVIDNRNIAPIGWHIPTRDEFQILANYLGGKSIAGGKLKDISFSWDDDDTLCGFNALPAGYRDKFGSFTNNLSWGIFWSETEMDATNAYSCLLIDTSNNMFGGKYIKTDGFSVRCLKDNITSVIYSNYSDEVFFYPNPANEKLYLKNINISNANILIFDLQGRLEISKKIVSNTIDISELKKGIYIIKLTNSGNVSVNKLIKE